MGLETWTEKIQSEINCVTRPSDSGTGERWTPVEEYEIWSWCSCTRSACRIGLQWNRRLLDRWCWNKSCAAIVLDNTKGVMAKTSGEIAADVKSVLWNDRTTM